ncbi:MAG: 1,4-dihydroxy-2-naphthoate polyprenyltransferase [Cyclobacteriaceae bacterium]
MQAARNWISAFRPRTLPLALSCILMGTFLAASLDAFRFDIFLFCALTTIFLQVLSNLANDYGDSINGADHAGRVGPARAVQSGTISVGSMRKALILFVIMCLSSGLYLLWISFGDNIRGLLFFLALGIVSIAAAVAYTVGRRPYGYVGLGDVSVLIFFGFVGVLGSLYLFTKAINWHHVFPALSCGFFSMAVLNINNIRDIESDKLAGKNSLPVRWGKQKASVYHWLLLGGGIGCAIAYTLLNYQSIFQFLFVITIPLFLFNGSSVRRKEARDLDPLLKQMALSTLLFVILFGIGTLLG